MLEAFVDKPLRSRLDFIGFSKLRDPYQADDIGGDSSGKDVFKEEFMNQLKLMDISISSPSHLVSPIPISFGLEEGLLFQGKSTLTDNFESSGLVSYEQA